MKKPVLTLFVSACLVSISPLSHASLDGFLKSVNIQARSDANLFNAKLSAQFGIPESNVRIIVNSVSSPADAFMVLQLGQMAHMEPELVLQQYQRNKGKGWGRLAQDLGIRPGSPEFHALKKGNLSFTGEIGGGAAQQGGRPGRGKGMGNSRGNGRGNGRGND